MPQDFWSEVSCVSVFLLGKSLQLSWSFFWEMADFQTARCLKHVGAWPEVGMPFLAKPCRLGVWRTGKLSFVHDYIRLLWKILVLDGGRQVIWWPAPRWFSKLGIQHMLFDLSFRTTTYTQHDRFDQESLRELKQGWLPQQHYPLVMTNVAIENGPVEIVDFPLKNGDFP